MSAKMPPINQPMPSSNKNIGNVIKQRIPDVTLNLDSFNELALDKGLRFMHERATNCPNVNSIEANSHDPNCTVCEYQGFLYYCPKEIVGVHTGNSKKREYEGQGTFEYGSASLTFPSIYSDGTEADFMEGDRLTLLDYSVRNTDLTQVGDSGFLKIRNLVDSVDHLMYVDGDTGAPVELIEGTDYEIVNGRIGFLAGMDPGENPSFCQPYVFSISYFHRPRYIVAQHYKEIRASQTTLLNGSKELMRMPQHVRVIRDYLYKDTGSDE
jgi:hypothetical protein